MQFSRICAFILIFLNYNFCLPLEKEPRCSKFAFEEELLEKTIRQEINVEGMKNEITKTQESVFNILENLKVTDVVVAKTLETLQRNFTELAGTNSLDKEKNEEALRQTFAELRTNLTKEIEEQNKIVAGPKEDMKKSSVAFFAHNVVDLKLDKTDKIIIYTATTTNEGSGYDILTGIFTAPVGGLFQFIVDYCSYVSQHSPIALVISENIVARSSNYNTGHFACSSFHAVIRVETGEKLWVKCISGSSGPALYKDAWMMNSFSGFLINK